MSGLQDYVAQRLAAGDKRILLMTHLIVGYPSLDANRTMLRIMAANDVDLSESKVILGPWLEMDPQREEISPELALTRVKESDQM